MAVLIDFVHPGRPRLRRLLLFALVLVIIGIGTAVITMAAGPGSSDLPGAVTGQAAVPIHAPAVPAGELAGFNNSRP